MDAPPAPPPTPPKEKAPADVPQKAAPRPKGKADEVPYKQPPPGIRPEPRVAPSGEPSFGRAGSGGGTASLAPTGLLRRDPSIIIPKSAIHDDYWATSS